MSDERQSRGVLKRSGPVTYAILMSMRPAPEPTQKLNGAPKPTQKLNGAPKPTQKLNGAPKLMLIKHGLRSSFALTLQHQSAHHQEGAHHHKQR